MKARKGLFLFVGIAALSMIYPISALAWPTCLDGSTALQAEGGQYKCPSPPPAPPPTSNSNSGASAISGAHAASQSASEASAVLNGSVKGVNELHNSVNTTANGGAGGQGGTSNATATNAGNNLHMGDTSTIIFVPPATQAPQLGVGNNGFAMGDCYISPSEWAKGGTKVAALENEESNLRAFVGTRTVYFGGSTSASSATNVGLGFSSAPGSFVGLGGGGTQASSNPSVPLKELNPCHIVISIKEKLQPPPVATQPSPKQPEPPKEVKKPKPKKKQQTPWAGWPKQEDPCKCTKNSPNAANK